MIRLEDATKKYNGSKNEIIALNQAMLTIESGEMVAVLGTSGCGKSTLLNLLGGMDRLTSGRYYFEEKNVASYGAHKLHQFRKENIGFVFQNFALINRCTVYENLEIPLLARNQKHYKKRIMDCLEQLGIAGCFSVMNRRERWTVRRPKRSWMCFVRLTRPERPF